MQIGIYGAGSVGCYLGGRLLASGAHVQFVGRQRIADVLTQHGLRLTDLAGTSLTVPADRIEFSTEASSANSADLWLVTVKSAGTECAAKALADHLQRDAVVISFQNGIHNAEVLRQHLPDHVTVITGMIPFNVLNKGQGQFHHGTEGQPEIEAHPSLESFAELFLAAGIPLMQHADMASILWGKLLLNLNNPINALAGIPLKEELSQRAFRRCIALAQSEALALMQANQIIPAKMTPLPPRWVPHLLRVPDWLFRLLGNKMLAIDPQARSSMWEDLEMGRTTEIDWINGELLKLAKLAGLSAQVNQTLVDLIRQAEQGGKRNWAGSDLLAELLTKKAATTKNAA